jgi:long-chain acyl-CoA synthetase
MKGYYNDSAATQRTLKNGWLHTGDIAEMDDEGRISIKFRKDNMIIRAGMNIYPQEIETALKSEKGIYDVLVYGVADCNAGQRIHLKAVTDNLSKTEVYKVCRRLLPSFQYPDSIEIVNEIPQNASGKAMRTQGRLPST